MAFFRKPKKTDVTPNARREKALAIQNEAKWEELERLVKAKDDAAPAKTNAAPSLSIDPKDLRETKDGELDADLTVDLSVESDFVDVTPETSGRESIAAMAPSEHFETGARSERSLMPERSRTEDITAADASGDPGLMFASPPPAINRADRADIGAMRLDVARISADIQSGEELYRRAQQRIENLTGFVERAEIDFSMLNRLEPENRRLKARNRTIEREIDTTTQKMSVLRSELEDREHRLAEKTRVYETTLGKLSAAQKSLQDFERALTSTRESSDRNALNAERLQTSLDVERRENEVLRNRLTETASELDVKQTSYIEAKKIGDSLAQDCADYRHQAESAEKQADELRKTLITRKHKIIR